MEEKEHIPYPYELFGIECRKGWYELLKPLFEYVEEYNKDKDDEHKIFFVQIKEKYGELRVYTNFVTEELSNLIDKAEEESNYICEDCGSRNDVGKLVNGWITTLCLDCAKKIAKEREYPQLWERESDGERFWINPDGTVEELSEEDKVFKTGL